MSSTTLALRDKESNQVTTLEDKEEMERRGAFSRLPEDPVCPPPPRIGIGHQDMDTGTASKALYNQAQTKASGYDRINFRA